MKNKVAGRFIRYIFVMVCVWALLIGVFAHPSPQAGILAKTYMGTNGYDDYYVGGEVQGWSIRENMHTNGTTINYFFYTGAQAPNATQKEITRRGAGMWAGTVTINEVPEGTSGAGRVYAYNGGTYDGYATFCEQTTVNTHLTSWSIKINNNKNATAVTLAHEFGHAIGLNDLYEDYNANKLMYGYEPTCTATGPTDLDKWGARVITGEHTSHTWGYKCHSAAPNGGNRHIKYCIQCKGLTDMISSCTYNSQKICTICGVAYNVNPAAVGLETELS